MCVGSRALEPDSSRVTPGSLTSTSATTGVSPSIAGTSRCVARSAIVTAILRPVRAPSTYVVSGVPLTGLPASRKAGVSSTSPLTTPGSSACFCSSVPVSPSTRAPQHNVSQTGRCAARAPVSRSSTATSGSPRPSPP